jgi:CheY-like chemotaxis protein
MGNYNILWVDDEIDLLKPHLLFLEAKGYSVNPLNNGRDALENLSTEDYDLVFLDEHMPGMSGLEVLSEIKTMRPHLPVIMITKNEEEHIMDEAIGSKIADYLIKPVNPNQVLLSIKKTLENSRLRSEKTNINYQQKFAEISMKINDRLDHEEWVEVFLQLIYWELEFDQSDDQSMREILIDQMKSANHGFASMIKEDYLSWMQGEVAPLLSPDLMSRRVFPLMEEEVPVFFILIDNLRYDQWLMMEAEILKDFKLAEKSHYYSILPTTTEFARNSIFSGLMPLEISRDHPQYWVGDDSDEGKNNFEGELLASQLTKTHPDRKSSYHKILHEKQGRALVEKISQLMTNDLNAVVFNFVDMLSHARTDMNMIKQLAPDEAAYRALTLTWFNHSSLKELLSELAKVKCKVVITTDHGTVRVQKAEKIIGDRQTNTNLRYKQGKRLDFDRDLIFEIKDPEVAGLPKNNISSTYAFAHEQLFFAYPNNLNYYANHFRDTFQHGGISMEEMILPLIVLENK